MEATETNLDGLVAEAIRNALTSDAIQTKVQAAAEKAVAEAINNAFGYRSDFQKGIEAAIKQVLPITTPDDLATFAHAAREVIQRRLVGLANETAEEHLSKMMESLLPDGTEIKMADFRKAYEEKIGEDTNDGCHCDGDDDYPPEYTWFVEKSKTTSTDGYWHLVYGPEEDLGPYDSKASRLAFSPENKCYAARVDGGEIGKNRALFVGPMHGFDAMLFRIATGLATLVP